MISQVYFTDAQVLLFSSIICHCFNITGLGNSPSVCDRHLSFSVLHLIILFLIGLIQIATFLYNLGVLFCEANNVMKNLD